MTRLPELTSEPATAPEETHPAGADQSGGRRASDRAVTPAHTGAVAPASPAAPAPTEPASGTRLSASEIHENVRVAAEEEMRRPVSELVWSSIAAGLTVSFSFLGGAYLTTWVPDRYHALANALAYPLGFIFVVQARHQLFTENTLEPVIPFLERRNRETFVSMLRLWAVVLAGNLAGALLIALLAAHTTMLDDSLREAMARVAQQGTQGGFGTVLYKAIFGGWLIALMAWLVSSTRQTTTQVLYIWLTTAPIAAFGFRHSIAGSVEAFYRAALGGASWGSMIGEFLVPALIGNVIGGVVLVALLNHGQVGSIDESPAPATGTTDPARPRRSTR